MAKSKMMTVSTPRPKNDGGTWWCRVGTAWQNLQTGVITVYLDAYPAPDEEGKIKMMLFDYEPKENQRDGRPTKTTRTYAEELDDEIPF